MKYNIKFASNDILVDIELINNNFYISESQANQINIIAPVTVESDYGSTVYQHVYRLSDGMLLLWNLDGKKYSFTSSTGVILDDVDRTTNGYYITDKPIDGNMFHGITKYSDGSLSKNVVNMELAKVIKVNDTYWFSFRDFGDSVFDIILPDGTTIYNAYKNGDTYVASNNIDPTIFEDNCSTIIIRKSGVDAAVDSESNIITNVVSVNIVRVNDESYICIHRVSDEEMLAINEANRAKAQVEALIERNQFLEDCIAELANEVYSE